MEQYTITALITVFTSLLTFYLAFNVGSMRRKHKSGVLETDKHEEVTIANRAHMNTIEISVVYLPLLWVASIFGPTTIVGMVGSIWFVSRVWFAWTYLKSPSSRTIPFMIGIPCIFITAILALYGIVM